MSATPALRTLTSLADRLDRLLADAADLGRELGRLAAVADAHPPERTVTPTLLTTDELALRLGCGSSTARSLVASGEVASVRIGRLRRVPVSAADAYVARLEAAAAAEDRQEAG